jgi:quinol monooxygenase YgiN
MIQVIATIELKPGCRDDFLPLLNDNVPKVRAEDGCLAYDPFVDVDSGLPFQGEIHDNVVTLVEAWSSVEALHAHLKAPHMAEYRDKVKDMVIKVTIQVLKPI